MAAPQFLGMEIVMAAKRLKLCAEMSVAEAVNYLNDLIRGLQAGNITLMKEDESVTLTPGEELALEARARARRRRQSFSLKLSWRLKKPVEQAVADDLDAPHESAKP